MSVTYTPVGYREPYLNISNGYAHIPCVMMREEFDWCGSVSANKISFVLDEVKKAPIDVHVQDDLRDGNVIDFGRSREQILSYQQRLINLLEFCLQQKVGLTWG